MTKYTTCVSRLTAEMLKPELFPNNTCLISINEPDAYDGDAKLHPKWYKVFRTKFWDVTRVLDEGIQMAGHPSGEKIYPINEEQAKEMAQFIKDNEDCTIIVHCRAGVSRSAAVARVLMEMGWKDFPNNLRVVPMEFGPTNVSRANIEVMSKLRKQFGQFKLIGQENGNDNDG